MGLGLSCPVAADEPTLARLSFSVPTGADV
jgi:hypothetical protein